VKGPKTSIESNFSKIQDLLAEGLGVKTMTVSRKKKIKKEPVSLAKMKESQTGAEIKRHELSQASPILSETKSSLPEFSYELKAKRPPLRKYIRKEGMPGHQKIAIEVVEQKPKEISIASLKEKFGLSESKIGGIIRDAEKLGKIRRALNGSYVWT
jgi:hypothetical protein